MTPLPSHLSLLMTAREPQYQPGLCIGPEDFDPKPFHPLSPSMTRVEVRHVRQSLERTYAGTGFVSVQYDAPNPRLHLRYHDPDKMHWTEVATLPTTDTTALVLMEVAVAAIEALHQQWRAEAARCEAQSLRRGMVTDGPLAGSSEPVLAAS